MVVTYHSDQAAEQSKTLHLPRICDRCIHGEGDTSIHYKARDQRRKENNEEEEMRTRRGEERNDCVSLHHCSLQPLD